MINVIVEGNKLGFLESKMHKEGYSIWKICDSGKIMVKPNLTLMDVKKRKLKNKITQSEFETINLYERYREFVKKE